MHRNWVLVFMLVMCVVFFTTGHDELYGQTQDGDAESPLRLSYGVTFGVHSFIETYQLLSFRPGMTFGQLGVGLDLPFNYRFTGGDGSDFEVREDDWVADSDRTVLEVYLPKIRYVRYGEPGDLVHVRLGELGQTSLGNGFIMNGYTNQLFLPDRPALGGTITVDGTDAGVPYIGVETVAANMAVWDLYGGRVFFRPLVTTDIPVVSSMQLGSTFVIDRDPYRFSPTDPSSENVIVWGVDVHQPAVDQPYLSLALVGDVAFQESRRGVSAGFTGRAIDILLLGGQLRFLDANFVPHYFSTAYDVRRAQQYAIYEGAVTVPGGVGWSGRLGLAALDDSLVFDTTVAGSFNPKPGSYPTMQSSLTISEGAVPGFSGFSFQGSYTRFDLRRWNDLADVENAVIGARFNIHSGAVVISLTYDLTHNPYAGDGADPWVVTSGLESTITF